MAASLRVLRFMPGSRSSWPRPIRPFKKLSFIKISRRLLLSEAYSCNEAWKRHLSDPNLNQIPLNEFAFQIHDHLEKTGRVSAVDVNVLAHQLHTMEEDDVEFIEDILARFNMCQDCIPRNDSTSHAIVRGFLASNQSSHLMSILTDHDRYGVFPNHYTLNLLMDTFIKQGQFDQSAKVAYCSMIQEDFSNQINALLSLHACVEHLLSSEVADLAPPQKEEPSDEEEDWIKVKYIRYPYYDEHFDIKDERFLLGKTLLMLGNAGCIEIPDVVRNSLRVIGCSLSHKFPRALATISEISESEEGTLCEQALGYFTSCLDAVDVQEANEPEVEIALRTIDDEIRRLLPTKEEKESYLAEFGRLKEKLASQGKIITEFDLGRTVQELVSSSVEKYETSEISTFQSLLQAWTTDRQKELKRQMEEFRKKERIEEMKKQVKDLQDQEELLTYFDFEEEVRMKFVEEDRAEDRGLTISK